MKMKSALRQHHQRVWRARGCLTQAPTALLRALKHYTGLHQRVIMMQVDTEDVANVPDGEGRLHQVEVKSAGLSRFHKCIIGTQISDILDEA
jgi:K+ transporter